MSSSDILKDDEYVAKLLAEDARKSSIRYSNTGLSALLPKRSTGAAPKPNTRFLQAIVKEANSHNAALKKKEELEARMRMRRMRGEHTARNGDDDHDQDRRLKRRRFDEDSDRPRHRPSYHSRRNSSSEDSSSRSRDRNREHERRKRRRSHDRGRTGDDKGDRSRYRRSRSGERRTSHKTSRKQRRRSSTPPGDRNDIAKHEISRRSGKTTPSEQQRRSRSASDPLESLVGPLPQSKSTTQVLPRGRGAYKLKSGVSNIDAHFSSAYDPTKDLEQSPTPEDDDREDWENALEALRDRKAWQQKQAARLKEAGFTDEELKKWEDNRTSGKNDDADVKDVTWSKRGEAREWDRGKVLSSSEDEQDSNPAPAKHSARAVLRSGTSGTAWENKNNGFVKGFRKALG